MIKPANMYLKRYTSLAVAADVLINRRISLISPSLWPDQNDKFLIEKYREKSKLEFVGAVCLTSGPETFHHWKTFADGPNGVCIQFDRAELERYVAPHTGVRMGPIRYVKIDQVASIPCGDISDLPFLKRYGFADEREYRIIYGGPAATGVYHVPIDLTCVRGLILGPFVNDQLFDSIRSMLRKIDDCHSITVTRSRLIDSNTWQKRWTRRLSDSNGGLA
ncbi:hypothetical protein [Sphingopyxis terrae]|uniref:hypothetical protein n=1 Tax=Sphingopyxis terrae TaxID=33052 RepID=UPI002A144055|nr:hypothetical protein [Sphingopyxis terrae]MDX8358379.1 hypothetical protein [Sphingopyxis terrae]